MLVWVKTKVAIMLHLHLIKELMLVSLEKSLSQFGLMQ